MSESAAASPFVFGSSFFGTSGAFSVVLALGLGFERIGRQKLRGSEVS